MVAPAFASPMTDRRYAAADALFGPGAGLAALGNFFWSESGRKLVANLITGLRGYQRGAELNTKSLDSLIEKVGSFPAEQKARAANNKLVALAIGQGGALIRAADAKKSDDKVPPADVDAADWRRAKTIDIDALRALLADVDRERMKVEDLIDAAFEAGTKMEVELGLRKEVIRADGPAEAIDIANAGGIELKSVKEVTGYTAGELAKGAGLVLGAGFGLTLLLVGGAALLFLGGRK